MGTRGPAPTPSVIQIAKGDPSKNAKKRYETEPKPPSENVTCPEWLGDVARVSIDKTSTEGWIYERILILDKIAH